MRSADAGQLYELVVRGGVGPVLAHVLSPCTVQRTEVVTVLRAVVSGATVADLVRCFDAHGWEVGRVALVG